MCRKAVNQSNIETLDSTGMSVIVTLYAFVFLTEE